jgi:fatty-acyl-CoA synthase
MGDEQVTLGSERAHLAHRRGKLAVDGVRKGDVKCAARRRNAEPARRSCPASRLGATVSLINNHLEGAPLEHAIRSSKHGSPSYRTILGRLSELHEPGLQKVISFDSGELEQRMAELGPSGRGPACGCTHDSAHIFTSGHFAPPPVIHSRGPGGAAFGPLRSARGTSRIRSSPIPSALLIGVGSCVMTRTPLALRRTFSATAFVNVQRYRATAMFIGVSHYWSTVRRRARTKQSDRVAVGNGSRADVWEEFSRRFQIASIREF